MNEPKIDPPTSSSSESLIDIKHINDGELITDDRKHVDDEFVNKYGDYQVIRRNNKVTAFDIEKIEVAMRKAFLSVEGSTAAASRRVNDIINELSKQVFTGLTRTRSDGGTMHIEDIQDQVELCLMRTGEHRVARSYVLYREKRAQERKQTIPSDAKGTDDIDIISINGTREKFNISKVEQIIEDACNGLSDVDSTAVFNQARQSMFDGFNEVDIGPTLIMSARTLMEQEPNYTYVASRLLLDALRTEALSFLSGKPQQALQNEMSTQYASYFKAYIKKGIELELLDPELSNYDLDCLAEALSPERDLKFTYLGLQTIYDRYLIHANEVRFELPQAFFMRVAMGLAINELGREKRAIEFYQLLSSFDFMNSTPTLFNSGTPKPQLSSCYLSTIPDDLDGIFNAIKDDAMLSKFAGGLGNDWTRVRAMGAHIKGTNGKSQGIVPFLKVANDTAVAVNQGGKRKGAICAYLECWHLDIEDFLELRKNTGDERRRTHDMNTAAWIPDLFMQRVVENAKWTLFSPEETPDLHDLYGVAFTKRYEEYEQLATEGTIKQYKKIKAGDLWRKILSMLFETGHPWVTFKDPCNLRSPQPHIGTIHSSNLCTEITLNTSDDEIAVCNLGSINLAQHVDEDGLDTVRLKKTTMTAMRMLDNVIDYNYYSVPQARRSNLRHRPIGLGIMGFQDALYKLRIPNMSEQAVDFADHSMEYISYYSILASTLLAEERGTYASYSGSLWSQGILPIDSIQRLADNRQPNHLQMDTSWHLDWDKLRERVRTFGMRNSNCMAIAPTATIANICGVTQSTEPTYQHVFVKSNLSGEFMVFNHHLVCDLKARGLWDSVMIKDLKYFDGSVKSIDRVPDDLKNLYACAFEIDPRWLIEATSRRQKWIDQSISLNLYISEANGKKLDNLYKLAWVRGLKTTYYLRSLGATHIEKTTEYLQPKNLRKNGKQASVCSIIDSDCEACQ